MEAEHKTGLQERGLRCTPFIVVSLCFLLPFFSVSSCDSGTETEASGLDIVMGAKLIKQQTKQPLYLIPDDGSGSPPPVPNVRLGPIGPDLEAQAALGRARPWTATALVIVALGACLAVALKRRRRAAVAIAATVAFAALIQAGFAITDGPPTQADVSIEKGMILAILILLGTAIRQVGAIIRSANRMTDTRPAQLGPGD